VFAPIRYFTAIAAFFLFVFGIFPVAVGAMYGGSPPPHLAALLDRQMAVFEKVAPTIFAPFRTADDKPPDKK
jgi:hypothetical protein